MLMILLQALQWLPEQNVLWKKWVSPWVPLNISAITCPKGDDIIKSICLLTELSEPADINLVSMYQ